MSLGIATGGGARIHFPAMTTRKAARKPVSKPVHQAKKPQNKVGHFLRLLAQKYGLEVKPNGELPTATLDEIGKLIGFTRRRIWEWKKHGWTSLQGANAIVSVLQIDPAQKFDTARYLAEKPDRSE